MTYSLEFGNRPAGYILKLEEEEISILIVLGGLIK
jgi:hypothetical protein